MQENRVGHLEDGLELREVRVGAEERPLNQQLSHDAPDAVGRLCGGVLVDGFVKRFETF